MTNSNSPNVPQPASAPTPASGSVAPNPIDAQTKQLAAMAYGEASVQNNADEMMAIASVLVRQRDARGYSDIATFAKGEKAFSFVVGDGNQRYSALMKATDEQIAKNPAMQAAIEAARNALAGGPDKSNGAYFWDGADIKSNYEKHFKVRYGIRITDPSHNIYDIKDSTYVGIAYKTIKTKNKKTGKIVVKKEEISRYDHTYDSTAGIGGTIFWKYNQQYLDTTRGKVYK
jgi:hypothetical protein